MGGAVIVVAGLLVWSVLDSGPEGAVRTTPARASTRAAREAVPLGAPAAVRLDRLAADRGVPGELRRNPFQFQARVAAPPPRVVAPPAERPGLSMPAPPPGPPPAPPIALKFIGIVESASGLKLAVLTDGKVVSHGQEGDIIEGRYRILKIGVESIEIAHVDGRGRQTIRLTGQ